jgi:hypothetical protein
MAAETVFGGDDVGSSANAGNFVPSPFSLTSDHLPGTPIIPDCVHWSMDGKVAFVTEDAIIVSTYLNKELSPYMSQPPFVTRSFALLKSSNNISSLPPPPSSSPSTKHDSMNHSITVDEPGTIMYSILHHTSDKTSAISSREISLGKGEVFIQAVWGPRGMHHTSLVS